MKIIVTNYFTGQHVRTIDWNGLLSICKGDEQMAADFLRLMRKHPANKNLKERWTIVDEEE